MRLKTFTAATMAEAMGQVRDALGDDAIIVSSQTVPETGDVWITAAVEQKDLSATATTPHGVGAVIDILNAHGAPLGFIDRALNGAHAAGSDEPMAALAGALDSKLAFEPLGAGVQQPIMLVGPGGSGKTIAAAKLAARERLAGRKVTLVTMDTARAGGIDQIAAFANLLKADLRTVEKRTALAGLAAEFRDERLVIVDTMSANPFDPSDMGELASAVSIAGAEPVLVMAAGGDVMESAEIAQTFAAIGCDRMIATRLDAARRYGGILSAGAARLALAELGDSPAIADGLRPADATTLALALLKRVGLGPDAHAYATHTANEVMA